MKTICGFRPSNKLHLGHYFSVIKPALTEECTVLIADLHCEELPSIQDIQYNIDILKQYGITNIIRQSDVFNYRCYTELLKHVKLSHLQKMPQYKTAEKKSLHKLLYPVMMMVDIQKYDRVIVGRDQRAHIDLANDYRTVPIKADINHIQLQDLTDHTKKMSKSHPKGCIFLDDNEATILNKCKKINNINLLPQMCTLFDVEYNADTAYETKVELSKAIYNTIKI